MTSDFHIYQPRTIDDELVDADDDFCAETRYRKLDLAYFTNPARCPLMVRRGARKAFELFLFLATRFFRAKGQPISPEREQLCAACGVDATNPNSRVVISRLLRMLRDTFHVIDYLSVKRGRPRIWLVAAEPETNVLSPRKYVYFSEEWDAQLRSMFDRLGSGALAAEYMYWIAKYEATFAGRRYSRRYWFFPLEKLAALYGVSMRFAGEGLRGLVKLGVLRVTYGQYGLRAPNDEFGNANRYYFQGVSGIVERQFHMEDVARAYGGEIELARSLATHLTNQGTVKNIRGLCELIAVHGQKAVQAAVERLAASPKRSLKRRLEYLQAVLSRGSGE